MGRALKSASPHPPEAKGLAKWDSAKGTDGATDTRSDFYILQIT